MMPRRPRQTVAGVVAGGGAIVAMNVNNMETVQAVVAAAEECASPVMLQISPGAIEYAGYETITSLARSAAERASVPVLIHLDHCRDPEVVRAAIADGFSSVMFDGSVLPFDENVETTAELVRLAHSRHTIVEAELGMIGGSESSTIDDARRATTLPADAARFVDSTDVDFLAPALGSLHRMPDDSVTLDVSVIASLAAAARRPLALHGGSGVVRGQLRALITAGVGKVNISSRVGRAFATGIQAVWDADSTMLDLRRYLGAGRDEVRRLAVDYLTTCSAEQGMLAGRATQSWSSQITEAE